MPQARRFPPIVVRVAQRCNTVSELGVAQRASTLGLPAAKNGMQVALVKCCDRGPTASTVAH
eukprot:12804509-Ditylum_brightwellii.AAC.1